MSLRSIHRRKTAILLCVVAGLGASCGATEETTEESGRTQLEQDAVTACADSGKAVVVIGASEAGQTTGEFCSDLVSELYDHPDRTCHDDAVLFLLEQFSLDKGTGDPHADLETSTNELDTIRDACGL